MNKRLDDLIRNRDRQATALAERRVELTSALLRKPSFDLDDIAHGIETVKGDPELLEVLLPNWIAWWRGPRITTFTPVEGRAGCLVDIEGSHFDETRENNTVTVGGQPAFVVQASTNLLRVLTHPDTVTGPVEVEVNGKTATGPTDFVVLPYPTDKEDGPPIRFTGAGVAEAGDLPATGETRVLVALVNPADRVPGDPAGARTTVSDRLDDVRTFYDQASYGAKTLRVDMPGSWTTLSGNTSDYVDFSAAVQNIKQTALDRLTAEAAKACQDAGFDLNNYGVLAVVLFLNGAFIRAWGGWDKQNFSYDPGGGGTKINITLTKPINLLTVQEGANWGRLAHEVGHNFVSVPKVSTATTQNGAEVFGEDVYRSDLVDGNAATAEKFEMMGDHDSHPLFSGYHLDTLGWYRPDNPTHTGDILNLTWDRNAFSQDIEVVAHGSARNGVQGRFHLVKIQVAAGLVYYVEVRQKPGGTTQVFDENIPGASGPTEGGVIVTKVITDTNQDNQQGRIITLLHDPTVLHTNDTAVDPARALTITVLDDAVVNRPLVCRVRVAWAQGIADDPNGAFDLNVTPWDSSCTTPDIWIDRDPQGTFDKPKDSEGRPEGNGDKPKPGQVNKFIARIHNSGTVAASNVKVTFYAVEPPGVGDNGNWSPLVTKTVASIGINGIFDVVADWVPLVGKHTCLRVFASQQLGEISGGNNGAQENVFDFEAPAFSPPTPVTIPMAVRNPRDEPAIASLSLKGVPRGFEVAFAHAWVHLDAHEERQFELVVIPRWDISAYIEGKEALPTAPVLMHGFLGRKYEQPLSTGELPGSRFAFMGGVLSNVTPKQGTSIEIAEDRETSAKDRIGVVGWVAQAHKGDNVAVSTIDKATGATLVVETATDDNQQFRTSVDLRELAVLAGRKPDDFQGDFLVFAETFAAQTVAEARSATLEISR